MTAVDESFGSFDTFVNKLKSAVANVQDANDKRSGWAWLVYNNETGRLELVTTSNQGSLIFNHCSLYTPLLTLNFWIDSLDLHDLSKGTKSYREIMSVINWEKVQERYLDAKSKFSVDEEETKTNYQINY